jgi:hypothetical protein
MAVTKQVYTATATWTASGLATIFRSAFIDAGLMTEWHDSFLSGSIENRVLEVVYDASKTYGKTYYWFMFQTTDVRVHICTGWNTGSDIPAGPSGAGTQYLDWFATTTNSNANHRQVMGAGLTAATDAILTRYTASGQSWFTLHQGASYKCFGIVPPAHTVRSWIDLDRVVFSGYMEAQARAATNSGSVMWGEPLMLRRSHNGAHLRGETTNTNYGASIGAAFGASIGYYGPGNVNVAATNNSVAGNGASPLVRLPVHFNNTNPAYSADSSPVFHSLPYSGYVTSTLPADFGIAFHYPQNTMSRGDKLIVSAGVEEWEILDRANNATVTTGASSLFLARVV